MNSPPASESFVRVRLPASHIAALARLADSLDTTPEVYIAEMVAERIARVEAARTQSFSEITGPVEPIGDEELDALVEKIRQDLFDRGQRAAG